MSISELEKINIGKKMYWEYRLLFDFPDTWKVIVGTLGVIPILSVIATNITGELSIYAYIKVLIILFLSSLGRGFFHTFIFRPHKTALKYNRSLTFSLGSTIGFIIFLLISRQFYAVNQYLGLSIETFAVAILIATPFLVGYSMTKKERALVALSKSLIIPTLIIIINYMAYPSASLFLLSNPIYLWLLSVLFALGDFVALYIPLYISKSAVDINVIEGLRGFFFTWFEKEYDSLEEALEKTSFERYMPMGLVKIQRTDKPEKVLYLITSYVHPGPLLNVGSSNLPFITLSTFRNILQNDAFVLHGTCSHGENQPSKKDVYALIERLISDGKELEPSGDVSDILQKKYGEFTFTAQQFGKYVLLIGTRSPKDFDDISLGVGIEIYGTIRGRGLEGLFVDAHNSLSAPLAYIETKEGTEKALELIAGANKVIEEVITTNKKQVFAGWSQNRCPEIPITEGLGPAGVMTFVEKIDDKIFAYIILDANNLKAGMREKILEQLISEELIDAGEVVTTDTHSVNAHSPGQGAYPLLGEPQLDRLVKCVKKAIKEALNDIGPIKADGFVKMYKTRILGKENIEKIVSVSGFASRLFLILLPLMDALMVFLNTVLLLLLP